MNPPKQIPKSVIFATVAAIGCFLAAIIAEPLFISIPPRYVPPQPPAPKFCLTFDDSGSMTGNKRNAVKKAAKDFVQNRDLEKEKIGIVVFSSSSQTLLPLSHDKTQIISKIDNYYSGGGTYFSQALEDSFQVFQNDSEVTDEENAIKEVNEKIREQNEKNKKRKKNTEPLKEQAVPKIVLFFTDGQNADAAEALQKSQKLRENGIILIAVATQDGNRQYLEQMTGDSQKVFMTSDQNIGDAFKQAEQVIAKITTSPTILTTRKDREYYIPSYIQAFLWSALLCFGMALFIVIVQNRILRKPAPDKLQVAILIVGAAIGGGIAGCGGDLAFNIVKLSFIGRIVSWGLLGAILAFGMSFYIPNLARKWALIGGGVGGILGAIGFLIFAIVGDTGGRLIGAAILGACIGAMIGWIETMFRNVWLMVMYDPRNFAQVNLGSQPVSVGSGNRDMIVIQGIGESVGVFQVVGDKVQYKSKSGAQTLAPGNHIKIGQVELVVCSKDVPFSPSKFYPMKMSRAREQH
ncbi:MAG: VWA domain-containing protein [Planctomycetaceae bacterium]|nr:VWA domain-containing protein [Planctomycetaceae bacterium]